MAKGHRSQIKRERNANIDTRAKAKVSFVRVSDTKARIVLNTIKGKDVTSALGILAFTPRKAARVIEKLLYSAIANAENNLNLDPNKLFIQETFANKGPTLKRIRPRAQGRAFRIEKRTSHITIILNEK
jgi:large subunit ribosomal protein L22